MMEAIPKSDMRDVTFPDPEDKGAPTWSKPGSDTILMTKETMEGFQDGELWFSQKYTSFLR